MDGRLIQRRLLARNHERGHKISFPNIIRIPTNPQDQTITTEESLHFENKTLINYAVDIEDYHDLPVKDSMQKRIVNLNFDTSMVTPRIWNSPNTNRKRVSKSNAKGVSNIVQETLMQEQSHSTQTSNYTSLQTNDIRSKLYELSHRYGKGRLRFQEDIKLSETTKAKRISAKLKIPVLNDIYSAAEDQFQVNTRLEMLEEDILEDVKKILNQQLEVEPEYGADDESHLVNRRRTSEMGGRDVWLRKSNTFDKGSIFSGQNARKGPREFKPEASEQSDENEDVKTNEPQAPDTPTMQEHIATPRTLRKKLLTVLEQQEKLEKEALQAQKKDDFSDEKPRLPARERFKDLAASLKAKDPEQEKETQLHEKSNAAASSNGNQVSFNVEKIEKIFKPLEEFFEGPLALQPVRGGASNVVPGKSVSQELASSQEESVIRTEFLKPLFSTSLVQSQRTFRKINLYEESSIILPNKNKERKGNGIINDPKKYLQATRVKSG